MGNRCVHVFTKERDDRSRTFQACRNVGQFASSHLYKHSKTQHVPRSIRLDVRVTIVIRPDSDGIFGGRIALGKINSDFDFDWPDFDFLDPAIGLSGRGVDLPYLTTPRREAIKKQLIVISDPPGLPPSAVGHTHRVALAPFGQRPT